ncbi:MAG: hypothetical protein ACRCY7_03385 [Cetobacterium sp.]|uniref:hypothetical protein n=1 Tax=Cetobacterium sp. TaxID=2071632 RepID=UPI003F3E7CBA
MIIYIYDIKTLTVVARPIVKDYEEFKAEPMKFYPDWDITNHISVEVEFQNPIMDNETIREKTREELILLDNKTELLQDGEYIQNNKIIVVEAPDNLFKKMWNRETHTWQEGATKEDIDLEVDRLITEFIDLSEKKEKYEKYGFETFEIENQIAENILKRNYLLTIII